MFGRRLPNAGEAVDYLQRRTVENRMEEPRRKFMEDHQLIHDRKKNEPCIPILPGHDQEAWFAKLDSHGIWKIVLDFITNPSDMTSAYFSCEMFRKHLEERRKMTLLPKVFEVLRDTSHLNYSGFQYFIAPDKQKESREILMQRLVSKAWKKSVENVFLLSVNSSSSKPIWRWRPENWDWESPMSCEFIQVDNVKYAMEKLVNPDSSSALLRMVELNDTFIDQETYYAKLEQFFALHGEAVWGLRVLCYYLNYDKICRIISSMTNLKYLELNTYRGIEGDTVEGTEQLRQMLQGNPFPFLSSLEFGLLQTSDLIKMEILSRSVNLKGVRMGHKKQGNGIVLFPNFLWSSLQNLRLEYLYLEYESWNEGVFRDDLLHLQHFEWPLKFLHIDLCPYQASRTFEDLNVTIRSSLIFYFLNHFKDSLEDFKFKINQNVNFRLIDNGECVVGEFPKLKTIKLPCVKIHAV